MSESTSEIDHAEPEVDQNPSPYNFADFGANGFMERMVEGAEYEAISKRFTSGMGSLSKDIYVVAIHKKLTSNITVQAKMNSFRIFTEAMARKCGGDANVKIAWHSSSREEVPQIFCHGFSRCEEPEDDVVTYGLGVNLVAEYSLDSAISSPKDESGLRHILLCRVIMGRMEQVPQGSRQFLPSTQRNLPPNIMYLIAKDYNVYKENKIARHQMIQRVRCLAGDELSTAILRANQNDPFLLLEAAPRQLALPPPPHSPTSGDAPSPTPNDVPPTPGNVPPRDVPIDAAAPSDAAPDDVPRDAAPGDINPSDVAPIVIDPSDAAPNDVPSDAALGTVDPSDATPNEVPSTAAAPIDAPGDAINPNAVPNVSAPSGIPVVAPSDAPTGT
ncbi:Poly(ADP-ribose) polymerase, catalytic domain containing protein [Parasponia andersonii]|uniref:Poly(ADP-ribose) polymerase, catalytic domain containing protein n=1 Tax=Parasponia andersonii TaxID=3476 RepID=A0A2P5AHA2_PARAD|nr:Poly(ADP-ribose) polymerase, catalytic domain containing protein [Parasponia andersonii]